jgi:hypothetical protein
VIDRRMANPSQQSGVVRASAVRLVPPPVDGLLPFGGRGLGRAAKEDRGTGEGRSVGTTRGVTRGATRREPAVVAGSLARALLRADLALHQHHRPRDQLA